MQNSKSCVELPKLVLSATRKTADAQIETAKACLSALNVTVGGRPVFSENPHASAVPPGRQPPDGELQVLDSEVGAFIGFYENPSVAKGDEPDQMQRAKRFGGQVENHANVNVVWTRPPSANLRESLRSCEL
jgi:hypothetical protein